jgi:hypothetical protein
MQKLKFDVPIAPSDLPAALQKQWQAAYSAAYLESRDKWERAVEIAAEQGGHTSIGLDTWNRDGLYAANALLATPEIASYEQAMELADWHFVARSASADGKTLRLVTRHGKKYLLSIPAKVDSVQITATQTA